MRLILHFGLHRAASSALQRLLNENRRALRRHRVLAVTQRTTESDELRIFKLLKGTRAHAAGVDATAIEIERHLAAIAADYDTVVFSDENMPGLMVGRQARAFAGAAALAGLLVRLGASHDIHAVAVLRRHADYLESIHRFRAGRGEPRDFPAFIAAIDLASVNFAGLLDTMAGAVAGKALEVFSYEGLHRDGGQGLVRRIMALAGVRGAAGSRLALANVAPEVCFSALMQTLHRHAIALPRTTALALGERLRANADEELPGRSDADAMAAAVAGAARRVFVPVTSDRRYRLTRRLVETGLPLPAISARTADALVAEALAAAERTRQATATLTALKQSLDERFAGDRAAVAARYLPAWRSPGGDRPDRGNAA